MRSYSTGTCETTRAAKPHPCSFMASRSVGCRRRASPGHPEHRGPAHRGLPSTALPSRIPTATITAILHPCRPLTSGHAGRRAGPPAIPLDRKAGDERIRPTGWRAAYAMPVAFARNAFQVFQEGGHLAIINPTFSSTKN